METFPAVVLTGPRQSGKTTLLKSQFSDTHNYLNLENTDIRLRAKEDPVSFMKQIKTPIIIDEIQYVPELLSYIKTAIDEDRKPGTWLLTGSQNFALMQGVSQSLAGRAAILSLLPLSVAEKENLGEKSLSVESLLQNPQSKYKHSNFDISETILRGSYPEIATNTKVNRQLWCGSYITTYLERDIRNLKQVEDLGQYEIFLRACASRTGQILDLTSIAREIGVSVPTAKRWISLLETGYQILLLRPYYKNIGKRLVKRPKIYFTDTGLASYLLGINSKETLISSPSFGPLFETMVVIDFWKRFLHHGQSPAMYYLRTRDNLEIDLVLEIEGKLKLIEIKSTSTIKMAHASSLIKVYKDLKDHTDKALIVSNSENSFTLHKFVDNFPAHQILSK